MSNPQISIIVPMYNSEMTIKKCISSIKNQTFTDFEVILIDDGSTDDTISVSKKIIDNDSRFLLISQKNLGASAARNAGIRAMQGQYMMFVDSDDYIDETMLINLFDAATKYDSDFVLCGMIVEKYNSKMKLVHSTKYELNERFINNNKDIPVQILDLVENEKINGPVCKLIKSDIVKGSNILMPENISLQEDLHFNIQILSKCDSLVVINETPYHYVQGYNSSVTSSYYPNKYEMTNEVHDLLLKYYKDRISNIEIVSRVEYIYIKNVYAAFINLFHKDCNMSKKVKIEYIKKIINSSKFNNIIPTAKKKGIKYSLLVNVLRIRNKYIIYYMSKIIKFVKYNSKIGYL